MLGILLQGVLGIVLGVLAAAGLLFLGLLYASDDSLPLGEMPAGGRWMFS